MIKILHCADLHLDSPFTYENAEKAEVRRNELRGTFTSMMLYAQMNNIDVMLMAGDLFDSDFVTRDTVSLMIREFAKNPKCRFIISPGNHDPYTAASVYSRIDFPDNVYIFDSESLSCFTFDDIGVNIYGYAFKSNELKSPLIGFHAPESQYINLLCAHADIINPLSPQAYIPSKELEKSGFDYVALGHIHNSDGLSHTPEGMYYGYSGCIEGRDYGETGYKGAFVAELEKHSAVFSANIKACRFSKRKYEVEKLDVSGSSDAEIILQAVKKLVSEKHYGDDTSLRIILYGDVSPELTISKSAFTEQLQLFDLDIVDNTAPLLDYEKLKNDPTIKGAFFAELIENLRDEDPEKRETAALALRYGLAVISGMEMNLGG